MEEVTLQKCTHDIGKWTGYTLYTMNVRVYII